MSVIYISIWDIIMFSRILPLLALAFDGHRFLWTEATTPWEKAMVGHVADDILFTDQ